MDFCSVLWAIPFLGIIFSMSFVPLIAPKFWHKYSDATPFFWTALYLVGVCCVFGLRQTVIATVEPIASDYISFVVQIATLYIISGGIYMNFPRGQGPIFNVTLLFIGSVLAGWIGTTGAATLLIRPFLRANAKRKHKTHLMVFFIFLIANIGGAATPLGDPPLFIGFLNGIDFFWFIKHLYPVLFGTIFALCTIFFIVDLILFKKDTGNYFVKRDDAIFEIKGYRNLFFLIVVLFTVILCNFDGGFYIGGEFFHYSSLLRNFILIAVSFISIKTTPKIIREQNDFSYAPIIEIATLFVGIFITVTPIIHILHKGTEGSLAFIFNSITDNGEFILSRCFWISGLLSSILDNAPTFLIFFHLASGDAQLLMNAKASLLMSFSISTVFMGALTYIGNAPNLMVRSISQSFGVKVPSFLGYMVWSVGILIPLFFIISKFL